IGFAADHEIQNHRGGNRACKLRDDIRQKVFRVETAGDQQAYRYGRVEMTTRYAADRVSHGEHCQTESERDPEQTNPQLGEGCRYDGAAATAEHKPEGAEEFGCKTFHDGPLHKTKV